MSITIIVPARNEEKYIADTISSLLSQTVKSSQIILVLDRCTDGTEEIANQFMSKHDKITKVVKNTTRYTNTFMKGFKVAETINFGLNYAKPFPDFIMIANGDSVYSRTYLEEAIRIFEEDPQCGMVGYSHYANISGSGYIIRSSLLYKLGSSIKECAAEDTYLQLATLNMGYSIKSIKEAEVTLMRDRGEGKLSDRIKYAFSKGYASYTLGYSFSYELARVLYWMARGKFSSFAIVVGYVYAFVKKAEKLDIAFTKIPAGWQRGRIKSVFSI